MRRVLWFAALLSCLAIILANAPTRSQTLLLQGVGPGTPVTAAGGCAGGAVSFDNATFVANSGASPTTVSYAVGSNPNRALAIYVGQRTGTLGAVSSSYAAASMGSPIGTDGANGAILGLVNPASGTNNLVVTFAGGGTVSIAVLSVSGACQTGGATTFTNYTTNSGTVVLQTVTIPSANGQMGFAGFIDSNTQFIAATGCTDIGHDGTGSQGEASCYQSSTGATVTLSYSTGSTFGIASGISIKGN